LKINHTGFVILMCVSFLLATACGKKVQDVTVSRTGEPKGVLVALPRETKNAVSDSAVLKETAVVVSVLDNEGFYVGSEQFSKLEGEAEIFRLLNGQQAAGRNVYLAVSFAVDFVNVRQILDNVRRQGVNSVGLLVERQPGKDAPNLFRVQILAEPDVNELLPTKPDPLTLVVSIGANDKVQLNQEPMGDSMDTANLVQTLTQIFQQRKEPERKVTIKARHSTKYGQVVRIIDAVKGAGANPIILQIDDLDL